MNSEAAAAGLAKASQQCMKVLATSSGEVADYGQPTEQVLSQSSASKHKEEKQTNNKGIFLGISKITGCNFLKIAIFTSENLSELQQYLILL